MEIYAPVKNTNAFIHELHGVTELQIERDKLLIEIAVQNGTMGTNAAKHANAELCHMEKFAHCLRLSLDESPIKPLKEVERDNYARKLLARQSEKLLDLRYVKGRQSIALDMFNAMRYQERKDKQLPVKRG